MPPHILIVDDEEQNLELAKIILHKEGYTLHFAHNGEEALQVLQNHPIDVMVLDLFMPEMDGFETLSKLRNISQTLPVIVVTAYTDDQSHQKAFALGANDVITKPYDIIELKQHVKNLLTPDAPAEKTYKIKDIECVTSKFLQEVKNNMAKEDVMQLFEKKLLDHT